MTTRRVKQYSDRGSIKDIAAATAAEVATEPEEELSSFEIRLKNLYGYAETYKDQSLQAALGIITTDYISDKNALPLSIYRLRQLVNDIKAKSGQEIQRLEDEFAGHLHNQKFAMLNGYLSEKLLVKNASARKPPVFRRVSK